MRGTFAEVVALAKDKSKAGRRRLATRFGHAFFNHAQEFTEEEHAIALDIMMALIRDAELEVRRELSEHLSREGDAPRKMVLWLARDVAEVAKPILQHSPVLQDDDLFDIIRTGELGHRICIAGRPQLKPYLSEALAAGREPEVDHALVVNTDIRLPDHVVEDLARRAADQFDMAELLMNRTEMTPEMATHLFWSVSNELRKHIRARFDFNSQTLEAALEKTVERLNARESDPLTRRSLAERLLRNGVISPSWLIEMVRGRALPLFRETMAAFTKLSHQSVELLLLPESTEVLAVACRALGFSRAETGTLIMMVRDRINGITNFSQAELAKAMTTYSRLTEGDAKTVLWQWQADPASLASISSQRTLN